MPFVKFRHESSTLDAYEYDKKSKTLTLRFHSGAAYKYYDVPQDVVDGLTEADSHGVYFHAHIKLKYEVKQIEGKTKHQAPKNMKLTQAAPKKKTKSSKRKKST